MNIETMILDALDVRPADYFSKDGLRADIFQDKKEIEKFLRPRIEQIAVYEIKKNKTARIENSANQIIYLAHGEVEIELTEYKQLVRIKKGNKFNIGKNIIHKGVLANVSSSLVRLIAFSNKANNNFFQSVDTSFEILEHLYVIRSSKEFKNSINYVSLRAYPRFSAVKSNGKSADSLKCVIEGCLNVYWGKEKDLFTKGGKFTGESRIKNDCKNQAAVLMVGLQNK